MNKALQNTLASFTPPPEDDVYDYTMSNDMINLANALFDPNTGKIMTYKKLTKNNTTRDIWEKLFANELGWLANRVGDCIPTGTITR